jgi:predicted nucleic acid-binding protein
VSPSAATRVLLDTTVLIDALRGRLVVDRLRGLREAGSVPFVCAINVEEIARGLRPDEQAPARKLFDGLRVVALGGSEGERAGTWRREFASRGTTLAQADCLIAAAAVSAGAVLATGNPKDFPMPELSVEHWPAGAQ